MSLLRILRIERSAWSARPRAAVARVRLTSMRRVLLALSVVALLVLASREARAQVPSVNGIVPPVWRLTPQNNNADQSGQFPHPPGVADNVINYADCVADLSFEFTIEVSGLSSQYNLVAWAGPNDCTALASREGPSATCWPLAASPLPQGNGMSDAGATTTFNVRAQDIVSQASTPVGTIPTTYPSGGWTDLTDGVCTRQLTDPQVPLYVWVFFTDLDNLGPGGVGGGDAIGVGQAYPVIVDTYAQDLGSSVSVSQSLDSQLTVTIQAPTDSDTVSYNIYCDPPPGAAPVPFDASILVPIDAAAPNACVDAADAADAADTSPANDGESVEASGSGPDDASTDAPTADASDDAPDTSPDDSSTGPSSDAGTPDTAATSSPPDDAGGNACGIATNDAGVSVTETLACPPSYLQSGSGSASSASTEDGGVNEAGEATTTTIDAGSGVRGTMLLAIPNRYLCGTASPSSPVTTITGLHDGYTYTIAVAAVDVSGNVGPLAIGSNGIDGGRTGANLCTQVSTVPDFWSEYTSAGGQAGGGYCATPAAGIGIPAGTSGLGLLTIASMVALVRARRRRRD